MSKKIRRKGEEGFIVSLELLFISVIVVIGLVLGLVTVRDAMNTELADLSEAIGTINQGFSYNGANNTNSSAQIMGSEFNDHYDDGAFVVDNYALAPQPGDSTYEFVWNSAANESDAPSIP